MKPYNGVCKKKLFLCDEIVFWELFVQRTRGKFVVSAVRVHVSTPG